MENVPVHVKSTSKSAVSKSTLICKGLVKVTLIGDIYAGNVFSDH